MPRAKQAPKRKARKAAVPVLGIASLSLAGGASAATVPTPDMPSGERIQPQVMLTEEEIADVSLATFFVFDKETAGTPRLGQQFARGCRCGGCRGCRGCARACRGCGGCGGCGCGGCGCCWIWGVCRIC